MPYVSCILYTHNIHMLYYVCLLEHIYVWMRILRALGTTHIQTQIRTHKCVYLSYSGCACDNPIFYFDLYFFLRHKSICSFYHIHAACCVVVRWSMRVQCAVHISVFFCINGPNDASLCFTPSSSPQFH